MTARRSTAVAIALLSVVLATAGCGIGPGKGLGDVELTVTHDYGSQPVLSRSVGSVTESDTVMRVLDRSTDIETRYGGGFVQSIDGVAGGRQDGAPWDWFFYVNGVESEVGAAGYPLHGGERIWWDYRDWGAAMRVPAVVGSWPEPFRDGYEGRRHPVEVDCLGGGAACAEVRSRLEAASSADGPKIHVYRGFSAHRREDGGAIRVLVGPWARVRGDPAAAQIEDGPQASGVFADFVRQRVTTRGSAVPLPQITGQRNSGSFELLRGLDQEGRPVRVFGPDAGLVAATRRYEAPPTWVVTGRTVAGARAAAGLLETADLRNHYAVAVEGGREEALPLR